MHSLWGHCYDCFSQGHDCSDTYPRIQELNNNTDVQLCPRALFMRIARGFKPETSVAKDRAMVCFVKVRFLFFC